MDDTAFQTGIEALGKLDDETFLEFVQDTLHWLRGDKIPFVTKYNETLDPIVIHGARDSLKQLMSKSLCKRVTSQSEFLEYLANLVGGEEAIGGK